MCVTGSQDEGRAVRLGLALGGTDVRLFLLSPRCSSSLGCGLLRQAKVVRFDTRALIVFGSQASLPGRVHSGGRALLLRPVLLLRL